MKGLEPNEIIKILKEIFLVYSNGGPSLDLLSNKNFYKFISDSKITNKALTKRDVELILASEQRKERFISFECFLQVLMKISTTCYPEILETTDCIHSLLENHIVGLCRSMKSEIPLINDISLSALEVLEELHPMMVDLYRSEFTWEIFNSKDFQSIKKTSQRKAQSLTNTLKVTPDLISHTKALKILKLLLNNNEYSQSFPYPCPALGTLFTFKHFIAFLVYCCIHSSIQVPDLGERLISFFQHIEAWLPVCSSVKFSLVKTPKLLIQEETAKTDLSTIKSSKVLECLESVFRIYSVWQEQLKKHTINLVKFLTILNNSGASSKEISKNELELIFIKITSGKAKKAKEHGKMDFLMFGKAINEVAQKLYPMQHSLKYFCKEHFMKLIEKSYENEVKAVQMMLKDQSLVELVIVLSQQLQPFTKYYMNESSLMNFDQFFKFCKDFSIFPDLIQRKKLVPIFYTLASAFAKNTMMLTGTKSLEKLLMADDEYVEPQFLNFDLFVKSVAICALEAQSVNRTPEEKLAVAIAKISQSQGAADISRKSGYTRSALIDRNDFLADEAEVKKLTFVDHLMNFKQND